MKLTIVHIVLQFNIDTRLINTKPYANIMHLSHFSDEEEVLIGLGATFQINAILTLCSEDNFELKDLMKQMKGEVISGITSIGSWFVRQGEYKQAENYLERIH